MNFRAYDILSSVVPGFLFLITLLTALKVGYDKDLIIAYTAIAFLLGYLVNTTGSWLEDVYFWTWGGKPSDNLLSDKGIWKVRFYHGEKARNLLKGETTTVDPSNDELFSIALRHVTGSKDSRIDDFNALYAFSRSLLTTVLLATIILLIPNYSDWRYYAVLIPALTITWLRSKQRGYYYAKEVLNEYLRKRLSSTSI